MFPSANIIVIKDKLTLRANDSATYYSETVRRSVLEKSGLELV